jgi:hypothetical protein
VLTGEQAMRKQQQGMTTLGIIILVGFLSIFVFGIIQMVPVYLENMSIQRVLSQTKTTLDNQSTSVPYIRSQLSKGVSVESLYGVNSRTDFLIKRSPQGFSVSIDYEREKLFVANVYLVAKFSHEVEIIR